MKYRIKPDAPHYLIGYGPKLEFVVIARMYSKVRAEQIVRLLNQDELDEQVCAQVKKESDHINAYS